MASIPDFNYNNVLPPHLGNPTDTSKISPYKTDIMEFCKKFATSSERIKILKGFIYFRLEACKKNIVNGFQWIDGSFTENIEASEKRAPHDIDVVSFISQISPQLEQDIIIKIPAFASPSLSKSQYHVDHYLVIFDQNPLMTVQMTKYWIQLFSHNRAGVWKGMIELPLYNTLDSDNEALNFLNSL